MGRRAHVAGSVDYTKYIWQAAAAAAAAVTVFLIQGQASVVVMNTPLSDEFGESFALFATEQTSGQRDYAGEKRAGGRSGASGGKRRHFGCGKTDEQSAVFQAVKLSLAAQRRMIGLQSENDRLQKKIMEIRLVDRAKCLLIENRGMTETEAHRYVEKQAMDLRITRREVAERIKSRQKRCDKDNEHGKGGWQMKRAFVKMHGCGNDYIYLTCFETGLEHPDAAAIRLSDRHKSIGGDGIVLICPSDVADAKMRMFNIDGSEGKMCGNAIRCVGKYLYDTGRVKSETVRIETLSGIKELLLTIEQGVATAARVDIGAGGIAAGKDSGKVNLAARDGGNSDHRRAAGAYFLCFPWEIRIALCLCRMWIRWSWKR